MRFRRTQLLRAAGRAGPVAKDGGETGAGQPAKEARRRRSRQAAGGRAAATRSPRADTATAIKASPLARRLAEQKGIDLAGLTRLRPRRPHRQGRHRRRHRQGRAAPGRGARRRAPACRRAGGSAAAGTDLCDPRNPARGRQALQHAQDDRPPAHRGQADDPAHLPDRRHPPRRAAQAARRAQRRPREARRQAVGQRHADQGARRGADRGAGVQRPIYRRPS